MAYKIILLQLQLLLLLLQLLLLLLHHLALLLQLSMQLFQNTCWPCRMPLLLL